MGVGVDGDAGHEPRNPLGSRTRLLRRRARVRPIDTGRSVPGGDAGAVLLQRALHPGKVVRQTWERNAPVALQRIEAEGLFIGVGAFDRVIVVEAIDAGAGPSQVTTIAASFGA